MDDLYKGAPAGNWQYSQPSRRDWHIAKYWINRHLSQRQRVLDVGCFDGGFLVLLGEGFERHGIEINPEAAMRARNVGIEIIGADFAELERFPQTYDGVIAMDVIEHMRNPRIFLDSMANTLKPGGVFIISTGNTAAWTWRLMGSRYWYCTVAEHVSFINPDWCRHVAPAAGLEVFGIERFAHRGDAPIRQRLAELAKNLAFWGSPGTAAWLRTRGFGGIDVTVDQAMAATPPMWLTASDHFMVLFRKLECTESR